MVRKNQRAKKIRNKAIWIGGIIGGFNALISMILSSLFFTDKHTIHDVVIFILLFILTGAFVGFIVSIFINSHKIKKISLSITFTLILIFTLVLGLLGIPPFGIWGILGNVGTPMPSAIIILPILPLILIMFILAQVGLNFFSIESSLRWVILALIILGYYYLLSNFIIYVYSRIKEKDGEE